MLDRLETCDANMIAAIINEVNLKINRGRLIVSFVFAVYAKHQAGGAIQNVDIIKALPPIDFEKCLPFNYIFSILKCSFYRSLTLKYRQLFLRCRWDMNWDPHFLARLFRIRVQIVGRTS